MFLCLWYLCGILGAILYIAAYLQGLKEYDRAGFWCLSPAVYCIGFFLALGGGILLLCAVITFLCESTQHDDSWFTRPICKK